MSDDRFHSRMKRETFGGFPGEFGWETLMSQGFRKPETSHLGKIGV